MINNMKCALSLSSPLQQRGKNVMGFAKDPESTKKAEKENILREIFFNNSILNYNFKITVIWIQFLSRKGDSSKLLPDMVSNPKILLIGCHPSTVTPLLPSPF